MKIVEYQVVFAEAFSDFLSQMNIFIKDGWQPVGGYTEDKNGHPNQAMARYEQSEWDDEDNEEDDITESKNYLKRVADELRGRLDATLKNYETLMKQKLAAFDEIHQLKKEIALLSERAQPRDGALKTCLEQNDLLKYTIDSNTVFIEALQKENEIYEKVIKSFIEKYMKPRGWNEPSWGIELDDSCYFSKDESTIKGVIEELFQMIIKWYKNENNR